jgi:uncharacterized protein (TIRG00374 family)
LLGAFFLYLAFKDISFSELLRGLRRFDPLYLLPATVVLIMIQWMRAVRFGIILRPFCRLGMKDLWDIMNIWGGLNMVLPARLAEFVKPYLVRQSGASFSGGVGAIMVERFFDLLGLLSLLALVLWTAPGIPSRYTLLGKVLLVGLSAGYAAVLLVLARRETAQRIVERLVARLPERVASLIGDSFQRIMEGLGIMASPGRALSVFGCSIVIWVLFAGMTYLFLRAFSIDVPILAAITIQVFICFGVALPSAPGFIGTFHAACRLALSLFGVAVVPAVSFATVYHVFTLVASVGLGIISYTWGRYRFDSGVLALSGPKDLMNVDESRGSEALRQRARPG